MAALDGAAFVSRLVVEGARPRWAYRCDPFNDHDTGWRFVEGSESDEWLNAPGAANCVLLHLKHVVDSWPELHAVVADDRFVSQWKWNERTEQYDDETDPGWAPLP